MSAPLCRRQRWPSTLSKTKRISVTAGEGPYNKSLSKIANFFFAKITLILNFQVKRFVC